MFHGKLLNNQRAYFISGFHDATVDKGSRYGLNGTMALYVLWSK